MTYNLADRELIEISASDFRLLSAALERWILTRTPLAGGELTGAALAADRRNRERAGELIRLLAAHAVAPELVMIVPVEELDPLDADDYVIRPVGPVARFAVFRRGGDQPISEHAQLEEAKAARRDYREQDRGLTLRAPHQGSLDAPEDGQ